MIPQHNTLSFAMKGLHKLLVVQAFALVIIMSTQAPSVLAADVLLMVDGVRGQGTLQQRGDECLIVTPRHVVENSISDVVATFPDRQEVIANILEMYAEDVALLRLATQPSGGCSKRAFNEDRLSVILKSATEGILKRRDESGSASMLQVDIVGYDEHRLIRIEPRSSSKSIKQGFSGSVLYIDNQPVGMLINNESTESDTGLVLRAEMLNATIDPFFRAAQMDRTFHISLDKESQFLLPDLQALAREQNMVIGEDPAHTTFDLNVVSKVRNLDTDTDKIVEYKTQLVIVDTLNRTMVDHIMESFGNSFISIESAQINAQTQLVERLRQSGLLNELP